MQVNKTHICHLVFSFEVGGLERIIVNCINHLNNETFHHTIISLTEAGSFISQITVPIDHYCLNKKSGKDFSINLKLYRLLRELRPDVLHTYNLGAIEYQWIGLLARVPMRVHAEHGRDSYDPNGSVTKYQWLRKICSYPIHRIVTVSQDLYNWLAKDVGLSGNKLRLIVNGVDTNYFHPDLFDDNELNVLQGKFIFGHVARLHAIKNQIFMLESFLLACQRLEVFKENCVLVIIGDGPDKDHLSRYIVDHPVLENRVFLLGEKNNVRDFYRQFDIFLMSSIAEGIPMTLLESMSMSVPHLVTDVGGISEVIIEEKTGLSVPSGEITAYCQAMIKLFNNRNNNIEMSKYARRQIVERFSQDKMVKAYQDIYLGNDLTIN